MEETEVKKVIKYQKFCVISMNNNNNKRISLSFSSLLVRHTSDI